MTDLSSDGVAFVQKGMKNNNDQNNDDWKKSAICHECGNKGHISPNCPNTKRETNDDKESTDKDKKKAH